MTQFGTPPKAAGEKPAQGDEVATQPTTHDADQKRAVELRRQISDADGKTGVLRAELAALEAKIAATPPPVKSVQELAKESAEAAEAERIRDAENARAREARKQEALSGRGIL